MMGGKTVAPAGAVLLGEATSHISAQAFCWGGASFLLLALLHFLGFAQQLKGTEGTEGESVVKSGRGSEGKPSTKQEQQKQKGDKAVKAKKPQAQCSRKFQKKETPKLPKKEETIIVDAHEELKPRAVDPITNETKPYEPVWTAPGGAPSQEPLVPVEDTRSAPDKSPAPLPRQELRSSDSSYEPSPGGSSTWADMDSDQEEMDFDEPLLFEEESPCSTSTASVKEPETGGVEAMAGPAILRAPSAPLSEQILGLAGDVSAEMRSQCRTRGEALVAINSAVQGLWSQAAVHVYGSMYGPPETQVALPNSDLDLVLCGLLQSRQCSDAVVLKRLKGALGLPEAHIVGTQGRSVLRIQQGKVHVDVTVDCSRHTGMLSSEFVRKACHRYSALRPLVLVLKRLLHHHGLGDTYNGGVTGYAVVLMAVRYLLDCESDSAGTGDVGDLLQGVLHFYGFVFASKRMGIRCNPGESYVICEDDASCPWACQPLYIEDPVQRRNNAGAGAWRFPGVQQVFAQASNRLAETGDLASLWA